MIYMLQLRDKDGVLWTKYVSAPSLQNAANLAEQAGYAVIAVQEVDTL